MQEAARPPMVEMFIASTDELHEPGSEGMPGLKRSRSMKVPPPRHAPPRKLVTLSNGELEGKSREYSDADVRALKNELGLMTAELKDASLDLKENQQKLRCVGSLCNGACLP